MSTTLRDQTVLITGANRGLGQALVTEALRRNAKRIYAASRHPIEHPNDRVTPLIIDVTNQTQIREAVESIDALDVLVNNAGVSVPDDLGDREAFDRHLAVNLYGTLDVTEAFLPALTHSRGTVINIVSLGALAAVPVLPAYSVSKAAALSLTQTLRALLAGQGVAVHAVLPGPIDTDMVRDLPVPKTPPETVASSIFDAIEEGIDDVFPDPYSQMFAAEWAVGVTKELERQNAALIQPQPIAA